jgi:hypothetical protein
VDVEDPGGRWCTEFFDKWSDLIEQETGVKIHNDGDGLTRMELLKPVPYVSVKKMSAKS